MARSPTITMERELNASGVSAASTRDAAARNSFWETRRAYFVATTILMAVSADMEYLVTLRLLRRPGRFWILQCLQNDSATVRLRFLRVSFGRAAVQVSVA